MSAAVLSAGSASTGAALDRAIVRRADASAAMMIATASSAMAASPSPATSAALPKGQIKLITCGSVDDGKSTLIGRLLWDSSHVHDDLRERLLKGRLDNAQRPDFSRLLDGLVAEQEQGITIDICWHYFDTPSRRVVVIDSPGHEQYTRNMATGASHADVGVILVDARAGVKRQTRRHLAILDLAGVRNVVLAVNKMDLVEWSEERFDAIVREFAEAAGHLPALAWTPIPMAAIGGDNVVTRSLAMPWYDGPSLSQFLDQTPSPYQAAGPEFRMPVQIVLRDDGDFRGVAGTITAGAIRVGDAVKDLLSGRASRVASISTMDGSLASASKGQAVVIAFDDDLDISRGGVLATAEAGLKPVAALDARLVWLSDDPYQPRQGYLLQTMTDLVPLTRLDIAEKLDLDTLDAHPADECGPNDIANARLTLARPAAVDAFQHHRDTGSFLILDALTGGVVAGGIVNGAVDAGQRPAAFELTRELLDRGLCADIPVSERGGEIYRKRATEAAILLRAAGVDVRLNLGDRE